MNEKRFFLRDKITVTMGNCNSVVCSKRRAGKSEKNTEGEDIEETSVVEIRLNCPPRQSVVAQITSKTSSFEILDVDSTDEQSLSDLSSFLSDDECDRVDFEVQGKSYLPKNETVTGVAQQNDFQRCALAPVENPACCSSWNEKQLQRQGNSNGGSLGRHPKFQYRHRARRYGNRFIPRRSRKESEWPMKSSTEKHSAMRNKVMKPATWRKPLAPEV